MEGERDRESGRVSEKEIGKNNNLGQKDYKRIQSVVLHDYYDNLLSVSADYFNSYRDSCIFL